MALIMNIRIIAHTRRFYNWISAYLCNFSQHFCVKKEGLLRDPLEKSGVLLLNRTDHQQSGEQNCEADGQNDDGALDEAGQDVAQEGALMSFIF